ncbi:hypothetical protein GGR52DRAFT_547723 [Hypoxylon sp. FL1284]|nr:hypothetical protein GGR52DRAFT_547723 [Hypoxylon sp. FL1284]
MSSSLRDVSRSRTLVGSPGSDLEPSKSPSVHFPGGEATRVQTPPLRESGQHRDRPRSFFFDIATPRHSGSGSGNTTASEWASHRQPPTTDDDGRAKTKKRDSAKEWWEVPVAVPRYEAMAPASFAFDLPEHLSSSPMCPANPRHKSGGTGVCVYHGRRKKDGGTTGGGAEAGNREDGDGDEDEDEDADVWT